MEDYYKILEVIPQASSAEIKAAYRSLCQEYHPEKLPIGTPEKARKHIEERFKQVSEAYSVISNSEANEKKSNAQQNCQKQLNRIKQHQQQRIEFFKSIPIFMLSEDYIADLIDEDQLDLLQSLNERNDAAELGQNIQAVAKVAIGVGLLAVLFGIG